MRPAQPTVLLVVESFGDRPGPNPPIADLVARGHDRFRFVAVSRYVPPAVRGLVEWHRIPEAAPEPRILEWLSFFARASLALRGLTGDLVHAIGPSPPAIQAVDLATLTFHWAAFDRTAAASGETRRIGVEALGRRMMVWVERSCYGAGRARVLTTLSDPARRDIEELLPGSAVALTSEGVDPERFRPDPKTRLAVRRAARVADDEVVAVFVGRERRDTKGLGLALAGFAQAAHAGSGPHRLWVLGTDGGCWRRVVAELGVATKVELLGFRPDIERFLQAADIFVLPTIYEVSCRAAYEAAACGLPIVAPPVHAVADLIDDDAGGLVVRRDPAVIAAALERLAADMDLRRRLGEEARRRALANPHGRFVDTVFELYDQLLSTPRNPRTAAGGRVPPRRTRRRWRAARDPATRRGAGRAVARMPPRPAQPAGRRIPRSR
ncbi:MAG: glycosyltransferase family 4 protein [Solirubrobacteraceae bacterium]